LWGDVPLAFHPRMPWQTWGPICWFSAFSCPTRRHTMILDSGQGSLSASLCWSLLCQTGKNKKKIVRPVNKVTWRHLWISDAAPPIVSWLRTGTFSEGLAFPRTCIWWEKKINEVSWKNHSVIQPIDVSNVEWGMRVYRKVRFEN
jgi:hypothetical protein